MDSDAFQQSNASMQEFDMYFEKTQKQIYTTCKLDW